MAVNIFNATMDVLGNNQRAYDTAYNRTDKAFKQQAARKAGMALASGDRQGAMQAMGGEGAIDDVRLMQADQNREDQQAYSNKRQEGLDAEKRNAGLRDALKDAFVHVATLPTPQERRQAMKHSIWQMAGISPEAVDALPESDFGDEGVAQFGKSLNLQIVNRGGGGYDVVDLSTGQVVRSVQPDAKLMSVAGGNTVLDQQTRKPVFTAPKSYAPPRAPAAGAPSGAPAAGGVYTGPVVWGGSK